LKGKIDSPGFECWHADFKARFVFVVDFSALGEKRIFAGFAAKELDAAIFKPLLEIDWWESIVFPYCAQTETTRAHQKKARRLARLKIAVLTHARTINPFAVDFPTAVESDKTGICVPSRVRCLRKNSTR
jgi:hypothetical protein